MVFCEWQTEHRARSPGFIVPHAHCHSCCSGEHQRAVESAEALYRLVSCRFARPDPTYSKPERQRKAPQTAGKKKAYPHRPLRTAAEAFLEPGIVVAAASARAKNTKIRHIDESTCFPYVHNRIAEVQGVCDSAIQRGIHAHKKRTRKKCCLV